MPEEKKYIRAHIKEVTFSNGGSLLNASMHIDKLTDHANADGWVKIKICERREPSEKGATHYAYIDEYKPEQKHDDGVHDHPLGPGFAQKDTKQEDPNDHPEFAQLDGSILNLKDTKREGPNDPGDEYEEDLPF